MNERGRRLFAALVLVGAVALAWGNILHGEFTYDDKVEVIGNRTIRLLENWRAILNYNWSRPLLIGSYALNYHFSGQEPFAYHAVDLLLQVANSVLALLLSLEIGKRLPVRRPLRFALVAAAFWALHPLASEAVAYVTGRSEQLAGTFALLGCWAWARWLTSHSLETCLWAWFLVVLAGLTKETAVTLPVAYLLLEWLVWREGRLRSVRWRAYLPGLVLLLGFFALRLHRYGVFTTAEQLRPLGVQVWTQAEVLWRYLALVLVPAGQTVFHDYPETSLSLRSGAACAGWGLLVCAALLGRLAPILALGLLWFLLLLSPSSSIVPLRETMSEHRVYLPMLGVCWIAAWALEQLRPPRGVLIATSACAFLVVLTHRRNEVWSTEVGLWKEVVERSPDSAEGWYGYGEAQRFTLLRPGVQASSRLLDPAGAYRRAVELEPEFLDAWNNLGMSEASRGKDDEAVAAWRRALTLSPTYCKAHNNLGLLHARRGRYTEAAAEFQTTLAYCRTDSLALYLLGKLHDEKLEDPEKAVRFYQALLNLDPTFGRNEEVQQRILEITW